MFESQCSNEFPLCMEQVHQEMTHVPDQTEVMEHKYEPKKMDKANIVMTQSKVTNLELMTTKSTTDALNITHYDSLGLIMTHQEKVQ